MPRIQIKNLSKKFADIYAVDHINFDVKEGEMVSLLGPSGCGKTTTLRMIAGLEEGEEGQIYFDDTVIVDGDRKFYMLPEKRGIGMVFQSYAIWPHMSVFENVAYPLKLRKMKPNDIKIKVKAVLEQLGLAEYENRNATKLSGGQQQRVALARAIVFEPSILLLDEPLSNLDAKLRDQMRFELMELQKKLGVTTLYVTHDQTESLSMSNKVILMNKGKIEQMGTPREIYQSPKNKFVSDFVGFTNFLIGKVGKTEGKNVFLLESENGTVSLSGRFLSNAQPLTGGEITMGIRPENIYLAKSGQGDNVIPARVRKRTFMGNHVEYDLAVANQFLKIHTHPSIDIAEQELVYLKLDEDNLYPLS